MDPYAYARLLVTKVEHKERYKHNVKEGKNEEIRLLEQYLVCYLIFLYY